MAGILTQKKPAVSAGGRNLRVKDRTDSSKPNLQLLTMTDTYPGPAIKIELASEQELPSGVKISASFKEFAANRRNQPLTTTEAADLKTVAPKIIFSDSNNIIAAIDESFEGIYDIKLDCPGCSETPVAVNIKIKPGSGHGININNKRIMIVFNRAKTIKILMPEGIFWDDIDYFDGSIENSESMTRYNKQADLVWREFR